jgi:teichuronic acid biosynthesis glycosyltransferase TuaC
MTKIRVLHVVGAYPSARHPASQVFIRTQIDSLIAAGADCRVLELKGRGFTKYLTGWLQVKSRLRDAGVDLIHAHYSYCGVASLGHGLPVVTSLLGSDLVGFPRRDGSYAGLSRRLHRGLARFVAARSAACIVKSERMKRDLGLAARVVPNGVDFELFRPVDPARRVELRRGLGLAPDTRFVLFAGNPRLPHKRFGLARAAVEAASRRVGFALELIPLSGHPLDDVARHMQACDLLLLTSSQEGSPNVVKEAMAAGMAVAAVDIGDTRERLAGVSGCRVADDDRPETIGSAIAELLLSDEPRQGREAIASLRLETVAVSILEIYAQVLAR